MSIPKREGYPSGRVVVVDSIRLTESRAGVTLKRGSLYPGGGWASNPLVPLFDRPRAVRRKRADPFLPVALVAARYLQR
jgi:hypothetical protein